MSDQPIETAWNTKWYPGVSVQPVKSAFELLGSGSRQLLARAADETGLTQPDTVPFNESGYQFWAVVRHPVTAG